jgi:hypothetical protein
MKYLIILTTFSAILTGCQCAKPLDPSWDRDCAKNYSETKKELDACKKRIENKKDFSQESGTVSIDPNNAPY